MLSTSSIELNIKTDNTITNTLFISKFVTINFALTINQLSINLEYQIKLLDFR